MSASNSQWTDLCERLNVKPKQFAILLVITVGALGVLGLKMFVLKPKKADASQPAASASAAAPTAGGSGQGQTNSPFPAGATGLPVVAIEFESRPMRDPFEPFFVYRPGTGDDASAESQGALGTPRNGAKGSGATAKAMPGSKGSSGAGAALPPDGPQGLVLKAIISGRVAVLNTMSVEEGDVVQDTESQTYTVMEIHERSIVVSDGHRRFTIGYTPPPPKAAAKGSKAR